MPMPRPRWASASASSAATAPPKGGDGLALSRNYDNDGHTFPTPSEKVFGCYRWYASGCHTHCAILDANLGTLRSHLERNYRMAVAMETVLELFRTKKWSFELDEDNHLVRSGINGDNGQWRVILSPSDEDEVCLMLSIFPQRCPEHRRGGRAGVR